MIADLIDAAYVAQQAALGLEYADSLKERLLHGEALNDALATIMVISQALNSARRPKGPLGT
jgi:hypothetical protein